jgi:hypothetical protein
MLVWQLFGNCVATVDPTGGPAQANDVTFTLKTRNSSLFVATDKSRSKQPGAAWQTRHNANATHTTCKNANAVVPVTPEIQDQ